MAGIFMDRENPTFRDLDAFLKMKMCVKLKEDKSKGAT